MFRYLETCGTLGPLSPVLQVVQERCTRAVGVKFPPEARLGASDLRPTARSKRQLVNSPGSPERKEAFHVGITPQGRVQHLDQSEVVTLAPGTGTDCGYQPRNTMSSLSW